MLRLTVGKSGKEDFYYIQEAIDAVPYNTEAEISVRAGIYREKIFSDKRSLKITGEGDVLITYNDSAREIMPDGIKRGTFRTYTAFFSGERLVLENLTIENSAGDGNRVGQAIALYLDADYSELSGVTVTSHQDTLFLAPLPEEEREKRGFYGPRSFVPRKRCRSIFRSCTIEGTVDFIFGSGDALFIDSDINIIGPGYATAPSSYCTGTGFVFYGCRFSVCYRADDERPYLMRPWRPEGHIALIDSYVDSAFHQSLWTAWPGREDEKPSAHVSVFNTEASGSDLTEITEEEADSMLAFFEN